MTPTSDIYGDILGRPEKNFSSIFHDTFTSDWGGKCQGKKFQFKQSKLTISIDTCKTETSNQKTLFTTDQRFELPKTKCMNIKNVARPTTAPFCRKKCATLHAYNRQLEAELCLSYMAVTM